MENGTRVLVSESVQVERKVFTAEVCENHLGKFIRLTEDVGGRKDRLVIPWSGVAEVTGLVSRVAGAG